MVVIIVGPLHQTSIAYWLLFSLVLLQPSVWKHSRNLLLQAQVVSKLDCNLTVTKNKTIWTFKLAFQNATEIMEIVWKLFSKLSTEISKRKSHTAISILICSGATVIFGNLSHMSLIVIFISSQLDTIISLWPWCLISKEKLHYFLCRQVPRQIVLQSKHRAGTAWSTLQVISLYNACCLEREAWLNMLALPCLSSH